MPNLLSNFIYNFKINTAVHYKIDVYIILLKNMIITLLK